MTGGNHTDWEKVPDFDNLGFPVAEVDETGEILITKVSYYFKTCKIIFNKSSSNN